MLCQCYLFNTVYDVYESWKLQPNLLNIAVNPSIFEIYPIEAKFGFKRMKTCSLLVLPSPRHPPGLHPSPI